MVGRGSFVLLLLCTAVVLVQQSYCSRGPSRNYKLLVVLVDGVRWDYPDEDPGYKGFIRLAANGVRTRYLEPVMPTYSYPNWYSLVTGLYAESHGVVANRMYDPQFDSTFPETEELPHWWNGAEPLWITAEKKGCRSALFWWQGCQIEIRGLKPSYCKQYRSPWPNVIPDTKKAFETVLHLFENNEVELAQIYYEPVQTKGYAVGPDGAERKAMMKAIDTLLDDFQTEMIKRRLQHEVNIMVVSDHGMTLTDRRNVTVIELDQIIEANDVKYMYYHGAGSMIYPEKGKVEKLYKTLRSVKGIHVYRKKDIPEMYHLKNNKMTPPLMIVATKNHVIRGFDIKGKSLEMGKEFGLGTNGYDPKEVHDMMGIFFARGPCFKQGHTAQPLTTVDVYNVMCDVLGFEPLPNNGSRWRTDPMMAAK